MMQRPAIGSLLCTCLGLVLARAAGRGPDAEPPSIERRFDGFLRAERDAALLPDAARAAAIAAAYDQELGEPAAAGGASDHDLDLLFRAAQMTAFYTLDARRVRAMESALGQLEARGLAGRRHYLHAQETFIAARMIPEALRLAQGHPDDVEAVPALREEPGIEPGQPTEWATGPTAPDLPELPELRRRTIDLRGPRIIAVSHPRCHFSRAAVRDIEADPVLGPVFAAHARWLAPPTGSFSVDAIQAWNREHPAQPTTLAHRRDEWPMIDSWATPTFYVLADGVVAAVVTGWPGAGRKDELRAALRRVGLVREVSETSARARPGSPRAPGACTGPCGSGG